MSQKSNLKNLINKHSDKIRFVLVGGTNTAIDLGILFILKSIGLNAIFSNYISTSIALIFSFFANKKFTFKDKSADKTQFIKFLVVTLIGLWVIQPVVIWLSSQGLNLFIANDNLILLIAKIIATCFSLTWNYFLYKKFVYKTISK